MGCVCPGEEVFAQGRWCLPRGGGVCPGEGVPAQGDVHLPLVDRMTDACANITFLQLLLRTVIICIGHFLKLDNH